MPALGVWGGFCFLLALPLYKELSLCIDLCGLERTRFPSLYTLIRASSQILQLQTHIVSLDHETEDQAEGGPGRHGECDSLVATQPRDWQGWGRFAATQPQLSWLDWTQQKPNPSHLTLSTPPPHPHRLNFSSLAAIPRVPSRLPGPGAKEGRAGTWPPASLLLGCGFWMLCSLCLPLCSVLSAINTDQKGAWGGKGLPLADEVQFIIERNRGKRTQYGGLKQRPLRSIAYWLAPSDRLSYFFFFFYTAQTHLPSAGITHRELS